MPNKYKKWLLAALIMGMFGVPVINAENAANPCLNPVKFQEVPEGKPLELVRDGVGQALIVVAKENLKNNGMINKAAKELNSHIKLATGADLPILGDDSPIPEGKLLILLGDSQLSKQKGITAEGLAPEGFRVKTFENGIAIIGSPAVSAVSGSDKGVLFGVYDLLERYLGIRWYYPGPDGTVIPQTKNLLISPTQYTDSPVQSLRTSLGGWDPSGSSPQAANELSLRYRSGRSTPININCHTPTKFNIHFKEHPECFELNLSGKREAGMPCYGNPKTADLFVEDLENFYSKGVKTPWEHGGGLWGPPNDKVISISPPDKGIACNCEYCKKLFDADASRIGRASKIVAEYVARVAREVKKRWPEKLVYYLPYANYTLPPEGFVLPDNVVVCICLMYGVNHKEALVAKDYDKTIMDWRKATGGRKVFLWEYPCWPTEDTYLPFQYPHAMQKFLQRHRDDIDGTGLCGGGFPAQTPTLYCWYRLMWNPDFNVDAALKEYIDLMYGLAKEPMRDILTMLTDRWENIQWKTPLSSWHVSPTQIHEETMPLKETLQLKELLKKARDLAGSDTVERRRVDFFGSAIEQFIKESNDYHDGTGLAELKILKVGDDPVLDGKLDDNCWKDAEKHSFKMGYDQKNPVPPQGTTVQAVWTDKGVTFGFQMAEPEMDKLKANCTARDSDVYGDDCIEIFLDVAGNRSSYYQVVVNSLGTVFDRSSDKEAEWNSKGIKTAAFKGKDYWSLEVYLPFSDFADGQSVKIGSLWYGNFMRSRYVGGWQLQRWNTLYKQSNLDFSSFGKLKFVE